MTESALPPGQIETRRFPVVGERAPSTELSDPSSWWLGVTGLVEQPFELGLDGLLERADQDVTFDIHCVTSWTRLDSTFTGIPLAELIVPLPEARFVSFASYSTRGHHTSLPVAYAIENCWVVHQFDGRPLEVEHGGPVRVVTPGRYFYKSPKWLKTIEVLAEDRPGWWEINSSYQNSGDPSGGDERFTSGSMRPAQLQRFIEADTFDKYRGRVLIGLDLRGWAPRSRDLRRLYLKNCDLSGVDLRRVDLRASNLSLSRLRDADLEGANLSGSDLEGADFTGANLSGADLSGCALSATRLIGAEVSGAVFDGAWGLLEDQHEYLVDRGVISRVM